MEDGIRNFAKQCQTCQRFTKKKKYSKILPKDVDLIPWDTVCIEIVGPYTVSESPTRKAMIEPSMP